MRTTIVTNPRCRNKPWWHDQNAFTTEYEVQHLLAGLVRALQPELAIETGAHHGITSSILGTALKQNGHGHLHAIEIDGNNATIARVNTRNLPVTIHHKSVYDHTPEGPIDFAFLDDHPDHRFDTFMHYWNYFTPTTIVAIHDTGGAWHQVPIDLQKIESEGHAKLIELPTPRGIALAQILK